MVEGVIVQGQTPTERTPTPPNAVRIYDSSPEKIQTILNHKSQIHKAEK